MRLKWAVPRRLTVERQNCVDGPTLEDLDAKSLAVTVRKDLFL